MHASPQRIPRLSIVIAAWNGTAALRACLASLRGQAEADGTEVIAVCNFASEAAEAPARDFPFARILMLPPESTVPVLRAAGVREAQGEIIALAEDHCTFDRAWCAEIKKAHELPHAAIGGSVENSSGQRPLDWAVYFYDYGKYMLPNAAGPVAALSGNNASYKRAALGEVRESFRDGFFESAVHAALAGHGQTLYLAPSAIVYHAKHYRFGDAVSQSFHLARGYAAMRAKSASSGKRLAFAAGSVLLPIVLPGRVIGRTLGKRRHRKELLMSLGYLLLLLRSWSLGEFCGYLFGEGGGGARWR